MQTALTQPALSERLGSATAKKSDNSASLNVSGINPDYFAGSKVTLLAGRYIKQTDLDENKRVIMVSDKVVEYIYGGDNDAALWQKITLNVDGGYNDYYIIGIYKYESSGTISESSGSVTTNAYIPITVEKEMNHEDEGYTQFTVVTATSVSDVSAFADIIESMTLCLIGGCFGIIVGLILGAIAASVLGYAATAPVMAILIAVGFSMVIGIFFGYYPANKAARLNPIEALRYE